MRFGDYHKTGLNRRPWITADKDFARYKKTRKSSPAFDVPPIMERSDLVLMEFLPSVIQPTGEGCPDTPGTEL
jgi:hypothetical protein